MKLRDNTLYPPKRFEAYVMAPEVNNIDEPISYHEALNDAFNSKWKEAKQSEIGALQENKTWTIEIYQKIKKLYLVSGCIQ